MLSLRRQLFVVYYLGTAKGNATLAAQMAGYKAPRIAGQRLLTVGGISEAITAKLGKAAIDADVVLARLSDLARSDLADFLRFDKQDGDAFPTIDLDKARKRAKLGNVKKLKKTSRTISRGEDLEPIVEVTIELELHDPFKALALLAKYHGLLDSDTEEVAVGPIQVRIVRQDDESRKPKALA